MSNFTQRLVEVDGQRLNVAEGPRSGPTLWLFHGLSRRWQDFGPLFADLSARWTVFACDHRGHGRSDRAPSYRVAEYVSDATALASKLSEPSILVGHSLGGLVALGVAAALRDGVDGVVLLDPPGPEFLSRIDSTPYGTIWDAMRKLAGRKEVSAVAKELAELRVPSAKPGETVRFGNLRDAAALRFMANCLRDLDGEVLTPPLEKQWLVGFDLFATAKQVKCPVLLVVADLAQGGVLPPAEANPLVAALPDCTRVDLPGVGHLVQWQDTPATLRLLHSFLGSL